MAQPQLVGSAPILLVKDIVASANYYQDKVGFTYDRFWGDPPGFCILRRDESHLMLNQVEDPRLVIPHHSVVGNLWNVYFWVNDAEALFEEFVQRGAIIDYELCDKPYGCLEFGIQDFDGYDIAFGQDLGVKDG